MSKDNQEAFGFYEETEDWKKEWHDMPEFVQNDLQPGKSIIVHFENIEDLNAFAELLNQRILPTTKSIWYPEMTITRFMNKRYIDKGTEDQLNDEGWLA